MTHRLALSRETLRFLTPTETRDLAAGLPTGLRDSIDIACFSRTVFLPNTKIIGNTCLQD